MSMPMLSSSTPGAKRTPSSATSDVMVSKERLAREKKKPKVTIDPDVAVVNELVMVGKERVAREKKKSKVTIDPDVAVVNERVSRAKKLCVGDIISFNNCVTLVSKITPKFRMDNGINIPDVLINVKRCGKAPPPTVDHIYASGTAFNLMKSGSSQSPPCHVPNPDSKVLVFVIRIKNINNIKLEK